MCFSPHTPTLRVRRVRGRQASRMARHRQLQGVFISIFTSKWWKQTFQGRPNDSKPCETQKKNHIYLPSSILKYLYKVSHHKSWEKNRYNMLQPWIQLLQTLSRFKFCMLLTSKFFCSLGVKNDSSRSRGGTRKNPPATVHPRNIAGLKRVINQPWSRKKNGPSGRPFLPGVVGFKGTLLGGSSPVSKWFITMWLITMVIVSPVTIGLV